VPFKEPQQEVRLLDARQTTEKHEENHNDDKIGFADSLESNWRPSREELPEDEVLEVEPTDFGQDSDVSVDDGRCFTGLGYEVP
jgi:hypothetical protein